MGGSLGMTLCNYFCSMLDVEQFSLKQPSLLDSPSIRLHGYVILVFQV